MKPCPRNPMSLKKKTYIPVTKMGEIKSNLERTEISTSMLEMFQKGLALEGTLLSQSKICKRCWNYTKLFPIPPSLSHIHHRCIQWGASNLSSCIKCATANCSSYKPSEMLYRNCLCHLLHIWIWNRIN